MRHSSMRVRKLNRLSFSNERCLVQHYEKAYKAGDLDPDFEVLTAFEARRTTNSLAAAIPMDNS